MRADEALKVVGGWVSNETRKRKYPHEEVKALSEALQYLYGFTERYKEKNMPDIRGNADGVHYDCPQCGSELEDFLENPEQRCNCGWGADNDDEEYVEE